MKKKLIILLSLIILYVLALKYPLITTLTGGSYYVIINLFLAIGLWIFRIFPYGISGIMVISLLSFQLELNFAQLLTGFSSSSLLFLISILLIGRGLEKEGLPARISYRVLNLFDGNIMRVIFLTPLLIILSPLIMTSAVSRFIVLKPVYTDLFKKYSIGEEHNIRRFVFAMLGVSNPMSSSMILSGSGSTLLAGQILRDAGYNITWVNWLLFMALPIFLMITIMGILLYFRFPFKGSYRQTEDVEDVLESKDLSFSFRDKYMLTILLGMLILWIGGSFFELNAAVPAIIGMLLMFLPGIEICEKADLGKINWDLVLFFGTSISIANLLMRDEISSWFGEVFFARSLLSGGQTGLLIIVYMLIMIGLRLFFPSNLSFIAVILPQAVNLGNHLGVDPLILGWVVVMINGVVFFPNQSLTPLLARDAGVVRQRDVFYTGVFSLAAALTIVLFMVNAYWPFIIELTGVTLVP